MVNVSVAVGVNDGERDGDIVIVYEGDWVMVEVGVAVGVSV